MKDIKNVQTQNIFRLSAILYSKTNDIVSNKRIIRRVIEDALYCCGSDIITILVKTEQTVTAKTAMLLQSAPFLPR